MQRRSSLVVLALGLALAACGGDDTPTAPGGTPDQTTAQAATIAPADTDVDAASMTEMLRVELRAAKSDEPVGAEVLFVDTIDTAGAIDAVQSAGAEALDGALRFGSVLTVQGTPAALVALADDPRVVVLDRVPPPVVPMWSPDATGPRPVPANADSRDTSNADEIAPGGDLGLDLTGADIMMGIIDGGRIRTTHVDFQGRAAYLDGGAPGFDNHATHVAGTMIGAGIARADARGFAPEARVIGWNFNRDNIGLMAGVHPRFVVSNHSYGYDLGWDREGRFVGDLGFGKYDLSARRADQAIVEGDIIWVKAAGNDAGQGRDRATEDRPFDCSTGFDCISGDSLAKNMIIIASVGDLRTDPAAPGSATPSSFTSRGPADDGRIKPDLAANGEGLLSPGSGGDDVYVRQSGTSMATPSVSGVIALLTEHMRDTFGRDPGAAEMRGLLIHTALRNDEVGRPNADIGWGVVDAAAAATYLTRAAAEPVMVHGLYTGEPITFTLDLDEAREVALTLTWLDPAGEVNTGRHDDRTPALVHDLDLTARFDRTDHYPWALDAVSPGAPARNDGPNRVDNVERIVIPAEDLDEGRVTITLDHTGDLGEAGQPFVLLASDPIAPSVITPLIGGVRTLRLRVQNDEDPVTFDLPVELVAGDAADYRIEREDAAFWLDIDRLEGSLPGRRPQMTIDAEGLSRTVQYATLRVYNETTPTQPPLWFTIVLDVRGLDYPTVDAGADRSVASGAHVSLQGTGADPTGEPVTFAWDQTAGPPVTFDGDTARLTFDAPTVDEEQALRFELVVSNGVLESAPDAVEVTVLPIEGEDEPANNRCATAPLIELPYTGGGVLDRQHDVDFYRFAAAPGETVIATTFRREGAIDTTLGITRLGGTVFATDDDSGADLYSRLEAELEGVGAEFCVAVSTFADFAFDGADARTGGAYGLTIELDRENVAPIAEAGDDLTVDAGDVVALDGSTSDDPDGFTLGYAWTRVSGPGIELVGADGPTPRFFAPAPLEVETPIEFELRVVDADGAEDTDRMTVVVRPGPAPTLTVDAGGDRTVPAAARVSFAARATGAEVDTWTWRVADGDLATFEADGPRITFDAPVVDEPAEIELEIEASGGDTTVTDRVRITVIPTTGANEPDDNRCDTAPLIGRSALVPVRESIAAELAPMHDVDHVRVAVLEDSTFVAEVVPNGPLMDTTMGVFRSIDGDWVLQATDDDGGSASFSRIAGTSVADGELCVAVSHFRDLTFDGADADGAGPYLLQLEVIPPEGANEAPVADAGEDRSVDPGALVVLDATGSVDPEGERLDYTWTQAEGPRALDIFGSLTPEAQVVMPNDLDEATAFVFELVVFDGAFEDRATVTITVAPNRAPTLTVVDRVEVDLGEPVTFTATASDPDGEDVRFLADELPGSATFDEETATFTWTTDEAGFFTPRVEARDPWGAFDEHFVTILVIDRDAENRAPRIAAIDDVVVETDNAPVDVELSAPATDEDGDDLEWFWQLDSGDFLGATETITASFDYGTHIVDVFVSDGEATSAARISVEVRGTGPVIPIADAGLDQAFRPREDGDREVEIALDGRGSFDPADRGPLTWSWTQTQGPDVALDRADSPVPSFAQPVGAGALEFELVVTVDDDGTPLASAPAVTRVRIEDAVDNARPGALVIGDDVAEPGDVLVLDGSQSEDPEGEALTWAWSFTRGEGTIDDPAADVIEATLGASDDGRWEVTLVVFDGIAGSWPERHAIREPGVVDNEPPTARIEGPSTAVIGAEVVLDASGSSDPDGDALSWQWAQTEGPAQSTDVDDAMLSFTVDGQVGDALAFEVVVSDGDTEHTATHRVTVIDEGGGDTGSQDAGVDAGDAGGGDDAGSSGGGGGGGCATTPRGSGASGLFVLLGLALVTRRRR